MKRTKIATLIVVAAALTLVAASPIQFHNLLSLTHPDTVPYSPPVAGDLIAGNSSGKWARVAPNTSTTPMVLGMTGDGTNGASPQWVPAPPGFFRDIASGIATGTGAGENIMILTSTGNPAVLTIPAGSLVDGRIMHLGLAVRIQRGPVGANIRLYLGNSATPSSNVLIGTLNGGAGTGVVQVFSRIAFDWDSVTQNMHAFQDRDADNINPAPDTPVATQNDLQFVLSYQDCVPTVTQFSLEAQ